MQTQQEGRLAAKALWEAYNWINYSGYRLQSKAGNRRLILNFQRHAQSHW